MTMFVGSLHVDVASGLEARDKLEAAVEWLRERYDADVSLTIGEVLELRLGDQ
jgi:hypothetical protein